MLHVKTTRARNDAERRALDRVKGLLFLRLAAVLGALAVILVNQGRRGAFDAALFPTYALLVSVCLANLVYLALLKRVRRIHRFAAVQIYLDVLFATGLIYLTGAGGSHITFLYFACILAASIVLGLRHGVMVASLATVMLACMETLTSLSGTYGFDLPWAHHPGGAVKFMGISAGAAYLLAQAIAYHLVAVLAGRLAHGLRGVRLLNEKILESISDGVLAIDNDRRVRSINRAALRLLGLPPDRDAARVGQPIEDVIDASPNAEALHEIFEDGRPGMTHLSLITADGTRAPVAVVASALREDPRRELGTVVMFIDLTERKRLEEALARAESMEMVGQLAASIAHEIRNPLACIRGSAQEVSTEVSVDEQSRKLLDLVVRESDRINAIVSDFLHFSKMRSTALKRCCLTEVLADVVALLEGRRADKCIEILYDEHEAVFCVGDVEQLRQMFLNLGLNALDAISGGGTLEVSVRGALTDFGFEDDAPETSEAIVEFTDDGPGMTDEVKAHLFDPFFTTKPRGTGLGLSIVRRIVEAHKGRIEVQSAPGNGSTFRVILEGLPALALQESHV